MKITKGYLQQVIKEELQRVLKEGKWWDVHEREAKMLTDDLPVLSQGSQKPEETDSLKTCPQCNASGKKCNYCETKGLVPKKEKYADGLLGQTPGDPTTIMSATGWRLRNNIAVSQNQLANFSSMPDSPRAGIGQNYYTGDAGNIQHKVGTNPYDPTEVDARTYRDTLRKEPFARGGTRYPSR